MSIPIETTPDGFSFLIERVDEIILNTTQKPVTRTAYEIEAEVLEDLNVKYSSQINSLNPHEKTQLRQHIDTKLIGNSFTPTEILQAIKAEVILELESLTEDGLILNIEWDLSTQKKSTQYGPLFAIVKRLVNDSSYDATYKFLFTYVDSHPDYIYNIDRPEYRIYQGFSDESLNEQEERHLLANWQVIQLVNEIANGSELAWFKSVLKKYGVYASKNS